MDVTQKVKDDGPLGRYFHYMLNMADDDLDLYEYRLLGHYRRVCGANNDPCTETVRETADRIQISAAKVSITRRALASKGWITIAPGKGKDVSITLVDRMLENIQRYSSCSPDKQPSLACLPDKQGQKSCSPRKQHVHHVNAVFTRRTTCSPRKQRTLYIRINNKNQPQNQPTTTDESPVALAVPEPATVVVDEAELGLILPLVRKLGLDQPTQDRLLAEGAAYALAVVWAVQGPGVRYPAGLARHMLDSGGPPELSLKQAQLALKMEIVDRDTVDRELRSRELADIWEQAQEFATAQESVEPPVATDELTTTPAESHDQAVAGRNGLDEKPPGSRLTWREIWLAERGQLSLRLNRATYDSWFKSAQAICLTDSELTIQVAHNTALHHVEQHRQEIEEELARLAGQPVRIKVMAAPPLNVSQHAGF